MFSTLANKLSLIRILLSPVFLVLIVSDSAVLRVASLPVFVAAALTDWYDGMIARRSGTITDIGKFLDPLADKVLTSAAFVAFAWIGLVPVWMVAVIVVRDLLITLLRSMAEARGDHIRTSRSAQWKTFIQMVVLYYLLLCIVAPDIPLLRDAAPSLWPSLLRPGVVNALMLAVLLLTVGTGVQYAIDNRRTLPRLFGLRQATD
jgi:CDP-diacylglycerol---glycerol-3-phosphate 3-phosphatidyltransferase